MSVEYCPIPGMSQPRLEMTDDEKKRWLWRYRDALRLEEELRQELETQRARACKTTAALTGVSGGNEPSHDKIPEAVERILEIINELQTQMDVCTDTCEEIITFTQSIADTRLKDIFRRRYIMGETWETIAEALGLSSKWVKLLHDKFLHSVNIF